MEPRNFKREEIDYICDNCGKVTEGPHKGEIVREQDEVSADNPPHQEYKGAPISHGGICEDCQNENRRQGHPWWKQMGKRPK